jgi:CobQ-like glutamine amidotransferase family enzyme
VLVILPSSRMCAFRDPKKVLVLRKNNVKKSNEMAIQHFNDYSRLDRNTSDLTFIGDLDCCNTIHSLRHLVFAPLAKHRVCGPAPVPVNDLWRAL